MTMQGSSIFAPLRGGGPERTLGERICLARDAAGLSTAQLARRLGVRTATLQAWESDRAEPRSNRLVLLAGVLGVSPTWLLVGRGDGPMEPDETAVATAGLRADLLAMRAQAQALTDQIDSALGRLEVLGDA
ncbi:helix-turn-helix domain-containing protein [Polymorphum gilvum]|uniref:Putative transcription regulator protein n=1 Tax=Polymorphum gilvum (strain LMG 25793 / CGMCC 1.9160 / SL003B-26A1) TaxID=991905 RepID=F2J5W6_POLGS|nr:helix-turn-helix domain-containing protein [Polymorphum gilvum]ADZ71220.1 Putative transcription regulator protein [Polymorphum gilvum SL003B-26A1]